MAIALPGQLDFFGGIVGDAQRDDHTLAWRGFTLDHGDTAAIADFRRRYGVEPLELRRVPGLLLVGPLPGSRM